MTAGGNPTPWTDNQLREGFSLSVGDDRFDEFLQEIRAWWERQPRTALRTVPRAARRLDVPETHMRAVLFLSGTPIGRAAKSALRCQQHGPMREANIRDALARHVPGCDVRADAARRLRDSYTAGASILALSVRHHIATQTARTALVESGATIRRPGRPPTLTDSEWKQKP